MVTEVSGWVLTVGTRASLPCSLTTWDEYIASAKRLNEALKKSQNIQGIVLACF
jgi:hypothetical protein